MNNFLKNMAFVAVILLSSKSFASELLEVTQTADTQVVTLNGNINAYIADEPVRYLDGILSGLENNKPISLVVHQSGGGSEKLFIHLMNRLLGKTKNVTMVIAGECSSSCTYIAPMAKKTIAIDGSSQIKVHRTFIEWDGTIWVNKVEDQAAEYGQFGANEGWFLKNKYVFKDDNSLFELSKKQALESGIIDAYTSINSLSSSLQKILK